MQGASALLQCHVDKVMPLAMIRPTHLLSCEEQVCCKRDRPPADKEWDLLLAALWCILNKEVDSDVAGRRLKQDRHGGDGIKVPGERRGEIKNR